MFSFSPRKDIFPQCRFLIFHKPYFCCNKNKQLACIFTAKISHLKNTLKFACKRSARAHVNIYKRVFCVEICCSVLQCLWPVLYADDRSTDSSSQPLELSNLQLCTNNFMTWSSSMTSCATLARLKVFISCHIMALVRYIVN